MEAKIFSESRVILSESLARVKILSEGLYSEREFSLVILSESLVILSETLVILPLKIFGEGKNFERGSKF